jgi:hypothetical protein
MFNLFYLVFSSIILLNEIVLYLRWRRRISNPDGKRVFRNLYWSFATLIHIPLLFLMFFGKSQSGYSITGWIKPLYHLFVSWNYTLFFTAPFYVGAVALIVAASLLLRLTRWIYVETVKYLQKRSIRNGPPVQGKPSKTGLLSRRELFCRVPGLVLDAIPFAIAGGSFVTILLDRNEFSVDTVRIEVRDLHPDLQGFRIIQISDLHVGAYINREYLKKPLSILENLRGDMLLITGDIIDTNNAYLPIAAEFLQRMNGRYGYGSFAITGNHDYIDNGELVVSTLSRTGIRFLRNESLTIRRGRGVFTLAGLDFPGMMMNSEKKRVAVELYNKVIPEKRSPVILMNHYPSEFDVLSEIDIDLILSGHTHGGQIVIGKSSPARLAGEYAGKFIGGYYKRNGSQLYVNRGLGHWFPLRINCPPEITIIELV